MVDLLKRNRNFHSTTLSKRHLPLLVSGLLLSIAIMVVLSLSYQNEECILSLLELHYPLQNTEENHNHTNERNEVFPGIPTNTSVLRYMEV